MHGGARDNGGAGRRSPLHLSNCGDQEDGRWSTPGWRSLREDGGGGLLTNLLTFSQQTVVERKSFVTKIVYIVDSVEDFLSSA